jgi:ATP-binding protein involved in chromosome partitioning
MSSDADLHTQITEALKTFRDPETARSVAETGQVTELTIAGGHVKCQLNLTPHSAPIAEETRTAFQEHLVAAVGGQASGVEVVLGQHERPIPEVGQIGLRVRSVIAVGSGKGGVGKSTVATSLALTLKRMGARVGLMDADVYGPSVPHLLNLEQRPDVVEGKIQPIRYEGMPVMSMGFLVEKDQPVIFRGPMLHGSITQFLRDTAWGTLDYLIIDMPPGTGDIALTLSQLLPLAGAVVVCTPQQVALLDAVKAAAMFEKTKIPLLGVVENMSGFTCPDCGKSYDIFGKGGARTMAEEIGIPLLAELPINMGIRSQSDTGNLAAALDDPIVKPAVDAMARATVRSLATEAIKSGHQTATLPVL